MENVRTNTSDRELFLSRTLNAPVDLVWDEFNLIMHGANGTDYDNKSTFTEVIPHKKIVFEHRTWPHHITTIEFTAQDEKTHLTWHMLFESAELLLEVVKKHGAAEGLKQNVAKFEKYLAAAKKQ
jgi:uncharacterized protein YndB with AHSA1/START domain